MLKATGRILKTKIGDTGFPDQGKGRGVEDAQDRSIQASPNLRKAWADIQVADHLQSLSIHLLQVEETARGGAPHLRAVGGDIANGGRGTTQDEDKDSGLGQARYGAVRSGGPAWESPARKSGHGAEQDDRTGKKAKRSAPTVSNDGPHQLCAFAQRLLGRWRSRRQKCLRTSKKRGIRDHCIADERESSGSGIIRFFD